MKESKQADRKLYMQNNAIAYILNRAFPRKKKFAQFFYQEDEYLSEKQQGYDRIITLTPQRKELAAQRAYNGAKLSFYGESFPGKIREFFQIVRARGFFKTFRRQIVSNIMLNARIGIVLVPAILTYFLTPAPLVLYSLIGLVLAISFTISGIYSAYMEIRNNKKDITDRIERNFSHEEVLFKEKKKSHDFEEKSGIKRLADYFIENPQLLLSGKAFPKDIQSSLLKLSLQIKNDKRISYMTKQVIAALSELGEDPMNKWQKRLNRIDSSEKKEVMKATSSGELYQNIREKLTEITDHLKNNPLREKEKKSVRRKSHPVQEAEQNIVKENRKDKSKLSTKTHHPSLRNEKRNRRVKDVEANQRPQIYGIKVKKIDSKNSRIY